MRHGSKVALTFDVDWAPEEVLNDTIRILDNYDVKATFFATHSSPILHSLDKKRYEIGLHPNFNNLLSGEQSSNYKQVIRQLLNIYPDSVGIRCHSLLHSSVMLSYFKEIGLLYDSNIFLPYHLGLKPFKSSNGLFRIPYFWEDDVHFEFGYEFELSNLNMDDDLNVFDFHPIHIFLNTDRVETYNQARSHYQEPTILLSKRNASRLGARDYLLQLLETIKANNVNTILMKDIVI